MNIITLNKLYPICKIWISNNSHTLETGCWIHMIDNGYDVKKAFSTESKGLDRWVWHP